ncbi:MAG: hypothetical protein HPZ79_04635 [Oscillospiraceae bacterium]|nr:hypothetical protein [Oscillospiraceae bacterium]
MIGEMDELREEAVKHFRMSDGSFLAVQYDGPVHYQDTDGEWQDIDNTLRRSGDRYVTQNGAVSKAFAASLDSGLLFETSYQAYSIGMSLVTRVSEVMPVPTPTPGLEIMTGDEDTVAETEQTEDYAASENVELSESAADEEASASTAAAEPEEMEKTVAEETVRFVPMEVRNVQAQVENPEQAANVAEQATTEQMVTPDKLTSSVQYADILEDTDFVYQNHGYDVKESIIIKRQQDTYSYSFALNLNGLTPTLEADGSVLLADADGAGIFEIPAPYLQDADGEVSFDAAYALAETTDGYVLTVTADSAWLNAEARAFPVTLDPTVRLIASNNTSKLSLTYVSESEPSTVYFGCQTMFLGLDNYKELQVYMGVDNLPQIDSNCQIVGASVHLYQWSYSGYADLPVFAYQVSTEKPSSYETYNTWLRNLTWNNRPAHESAILDYQTAHPNSSGYLSFDLTKAVQNWYIDTSLPRAIALASDGAHAANSRLYAYASQCAPILAIQYRNMIGLEDYYTYQSFGVGRAGTMYLSDHTNSMTIARTDVSLNLDPAPFSLTYYYNSGNRGAYFDDGYVGVNTCSYDTMRVGSGWKLSVQQTVVEKTLENDTYLIYADADGTEHYFSKDASGNYVDEDGLGLKISVSTSGGNTIYTMTDTDAYNTWVFHNGYLISQTDNNYNAIYIAYNGNAYSDTSSAWKPVKGSANRITTVVQNTNGGGLVTVASMSYNSDDKLTAIEDYAGRTTHYSYDNVYLTGVTYPDGTTVSYEYSSGAWLSALYDSESNYGVEMTYSEHDEGQFYRQTVNQVKEFTQVNNARVYGNQFHAYRNSGHLTSCRYYGADQTADTADDLVVYNVLDHYGRTITSYTTDYQKEKLLGVTAGAYKANGMTSATNNRLTKSASSGQHVENLLLNSGMEYTVDNSGTPSNWRKDCSKDDITITNAAVGSTYSFSDRTVQAHTGQGLLKAYIGNVDTTTGYHSELRQSVQLTQGVTYTFSAYVNTYTVNQFGDGYGAYIGFRNNTEDADFVEKSEIIDYRTNPGIENGWERLSVSFTPDTSGVYYLAVGMQGAQGIAAFDDVQLEVGDTVSSVNLLQNSGFEVGSQLSTYWSGIGSTGNTLADPKSEIAVVRGQVLHISGASSADKQVSQNVKINQDSDVTFLLSGWGCADSVPFYAKEDGTYERFFGLIAKITYTDNTTENHYVPFDASYSGWQYASGIIVPKQSNKTVSTVTVQCAYNKNANDAYFDGVSLIEEPVQTYSYDSKGNPIAATDGKAKSASEYYSGTSKLKSYTTPSGTKHELWYDNNNNVQEERLHNLSTYTDYNFAGGVTNSITSVGYSGDYLASYYWYSPNLHFKTKSEDVNGITTEYEYNDPTRTLASVKNAYGTTQAYGYNADNDRVVQTYIHNMDAMWYAYQNGQLSTLTRKSFLSSNGETVTGPFWQQYALAYDAFGNTTQVSVSGSTDGATYASPVMLASYAYENNTNGRLAQMAYGNRDTVNYKYDLFDRKTAETYNDGTSYHYEYDAEGSLAGQYATDASGAATERYSYEYDSLGRLIHSKELDGSGNMVQRTEHLYDTSNRLRQQNWMFADGASFGQDYSYSNGADGDGTLTKVDSSATMDGYGFYPSVTYTYTPLRQVRRKTTDNLFYRAYSYRLLNGGWRRSSQVEFMNYRKPNGDALILGYQYMYDERGNVSAVYKSKASGGVEATAAQAYTYDALGQLTAVTDTDTGHTYSYTYDTAGNLRSMVRTATATNAKTTTKLTYANTSWPDLLTSVTVGGTTKSITYQTTNGNLTGNPITYYNGTDYTFGWGKGTQLTSATVGDTEISYTYDMSGVRSSKTVGGTTHTYTTLSGLVMQETDGTQELYFLYDDSNQPYALVYKSSATATPSLYYYMLNVQGDVIALMNASGTIVAEYQYDPWGVPTVKTASGAQGNDAAIGNVNPLRYRGYYYDTETGFYYLQSRYYDPAIGRFISADSYATTDCNGFLSANMFAYCENNPVMKEDRDGEFNTAAAVIGAVTSGISAYASGGNLKNIIFASTTGFFSAGLKNNLLVAAVNLCAAVYDGYQVYKNSGKWSNAVLAGVISFGASNITGGNLNRIKGLNANLTNIGKNLFDSSFAFGAKLSAGGTNAALATPSPKSSSATAANRRNPHLDRRASAAKRFEGMRYYVDSHGNGRWVYVG